MTSHGSHFCNAHLLILRKIFNETKQPKVWEVSLRKRLNEIAKVLPHFNPAATGLEPTSPKAPEALNDPLVVGDNLDVKQIRSWSCYD